ncbi:MAG: hypothetical protein ACLR6B_12590 [Blautia sp.]
MSERKGLYREQFEHDNCGIGAVVNSKGIKSHKTVENALHIVENLEHRAGKDAEGKTGDGVGILYRYPINSSVRWQKRKALRSAAKEIMVSHSCFSRRMR